MSDLENWPKRICLFTEIYDPESGNRIFSKELKPYDQTSYREISWWDADETNPEIAKVEYIRADIAKEREKQLLIAHAILIKTGSSSIDYEDIYKEAGLEELK